MWCTNTESNKTRKHLNDVRRSKILSIVRILYCIVGLVVFILIYPKLRYRAFSSPSSLASMNIGVIMDGDEIRQSLTIPGDYLDTLSIMTATYDRINDGTVVISLEDENGKVITTEYIEASELKNNDYTDIKLSKALTGFKDKKMDLVITTKDVLNGSAVTFYLGQVSEKNQAMIAPYRYAKLNGKRADGMLCIRMIGRNTVYLYLLYWILMLIVWFV